MHEPGPATAPTPQVETSARTRSLVAAVLVTLLVTTLGCAGDPQAAAPQELKLATGWKSTAWNLIGQALADEYRKHIPGLVVSAEPIADLYQKVDALQQGTLDLAFVDSETAYRAYKTGTPGDPTPHTKLRAIAVLFPTVVQIVVRADADIDTPRELRGKRVEVGVKGGYADQATQLILESYGLGDAVSILHTSEVEPETELRQRQVDAVVYWTPLHHPSITRVLNTLPATLIGLEHEQIGFLQSRNHFLKSTVIPAGSYANQPHDVLTVGEDVLLLCRQDLDDGLVQRMTQALFDAAPTLRTVNAAADGIDVLRGPTASIPLHLGAARYYRERELLK
jgi:uncharacterized protein